MNTIYEALPQLQMIYYKKARPSKSWLDFAGFSPRFAVLCFLGPFILGVGLLVATYQLFLHSLRQPISLKMLIWLSMIALIICIISGTCFLATWLTKAGRKLDSRWHGITDAAAAFFALVVLVQIAFGTARLSYISLSAVRNRELMLHGRASVFPVQRRDCFEGHGRYCDLYIQVPDLEGQAHTISETFSDNAETANIHGVSIYYLPANPEHYRLLTRN